MPLQDASYLHPWHKMARNSLTFKLKSIILSRRWAHAALILQWDENFDVGAGTGTPVDDQDYQVPSGSLVCLRSSRSRSTGRGSIQPTKNVS
jgi:hypothetical protein